MTTKYAIGGYDVDTGRDYIQKTDIIDVYPDILGSSKHTGLWATGSNTSGILGTGSQSFVSGIEQVVGGVGSWVDVDMGAWHSAAIKSDGSLWTWGDGPQGALGTGNTLSTSIPTHVQPGSRWRRVSAGGQHTLVVKSDGTLWATGANSSGQLGIGGVTSRSSLVQVGVKDDWVVVSAGYTTSAAIDDAGRMWTWGSNQFGQLGASMDPAQPVPLTPVQPVVSGPVWADVSCGSYFVAGIMKDHTLWMWGGNHYGQLGDGTVTHRSSPVQTIAGGYDWAQVSCGFYTTAAIKVDGTLWMWGDNDQGGHGAMLGVNSSASSLAVSSPIQTVAGGTTWKRVRVGGSTVAAIKTDGTLWVWGLDPTYAQPVRLSSPTQIARSESWKRVTVCNDLNSVLVIREEQDW